jgi:CrcB protein
MAPDAPAGDPTAPDQPVGVEADLAVDPDVAPTDVRTRRRLAVEIPLVAGVAAGGIAGALARDAVAHAWPVPAGSFPASTLVINASGSLVLAFLLILLAERFPRSRMVRPVLGTGVVGAYTTFSTMVVEVDQLARTGHGALAVGYLLASLGTGVAAVVAGFAAGRAVARAGRHRASGSAA